MPQDRRDEILDAATALFAERGYDGASLQDVAERVGVRKASLFHHFENKDALYDAVLQRLVAGLQAPLEAIYAHDGTYAERLDLLTETLVSALGARPHAARLLVREAMDWGPRMRSGMAERILFVLEAGAAWIRAGQEAGAFAGGDAKHIVLTALGAHFMPFVLDRLVERYTGASPFGPKFVAARKRELSEQMKRVHLAPRRRARVTP